VDRDKPRAVIWIRRKYVANGEQFVYFAENVAASPGRPRSVKKDTKAWRIRTERHREERSDAAIQAS